MSGMRANTIPLKATAIDGEVVVCGEGPRPIDSSYTPEAIFESLEPLKKAAEDAASFSGSTSVADTAEETSQL